VTTCTTLITRHNENGRDTSISSRDRAAIKWAQIPGPSSQTARKKGFKKGHGHTAMAFGMRKCSRI
jgi:hypothetical protein